MSEIVDYDIADEIREAAPADPGETTLPAPIIFPSSQRYSILDRMHFRALDSDFNTTTLVDAYDSMIWTERYNEVGDFEIFGSANQQLHDVMLSSSYIFNSATSKVMVIEKTKVEYDEELGNTITISGRSLESLLDRRIMLTPLTILNSTDNRISQMLCNLVTLCFGPANASRHWNKLEVVNGTLLTSREIPADVPIQFFIGENLLDIIWNFSGAFGLGFKCELCPLTRMVTFEMYEGADLSGFGASMVVFSDLYDSLTTSMEELAFGHLKTVGLVTGNHVDETTQVPLLTQIVSVSPETGLSRREKHIDVDQEKVIYNSDGTTITMTNAQYISALQEAGLDDLNSLDNKTHREYDGEILEVMYRYGNDFTLGDIVSLWLPHNQRLRARINGVTFSDDTNEGKTLAPSFEYLD